MLGIEVERAGIFKCLKSGNAFVGVIWADGTYEFTHGPVGDETNPLQVLKITRTRCMGTRVQGPLATKMWNNYYALRNKASAYKIWTKNWREKSD